MPIWESYLILVPKLVKNKITVGNITDRDGDVKLFGPKFQNSNILTSVKTHSDRAYTENRETSMFGRSSIELLLKMNRPSCPIRKT